MATIRKILPRCTLVRIDSETVEDLTPKTRRDVESKIATCWDSPYHRAYPLYEFFVDTST